MHNGAGEVLQTVLRTSSCAQVILYKVGICLGLCWKLGSSFIPQLNNKIIMSFKPETGQE